MLSGSLSPCLVLEPLLNYCCYCTYHIYVTADSVKGHFFYSLHFDQRYTGDRGGMATAQIRGPKPYRVGGDFALSVRRFEAYARTVKIPNAQIHWSAHVDIEYSNHRIYAGCCVFYKNKNKQTANHRICLLHQCRLPFMGMLFSNF